MRAVPSATSANGFQISGFDRKTRQAAILQIAAGSSPTCDSLGLLASADCRRKVGLSARRTRVRTLRRMTLRIFDCEPRLADMQRLADDLCPCQSALITETSTGGFAWYRGASRLDLHGERRCPGARPPSCGSMNGHLRREHRLDRVAARCFQRRRLKQPPRPHAPTTTGFIVGRGANRGSFRRRTDQSFEIYPATAKMNHSGRSSVRSKAARAE